MWNGKGLSVIVGFILLLLIGMIFLSVVQTQYIPSILKSVEMKHINDLTFKLSEVRDAVVSGKKISITFKLGTNYPKYLFLLTPSSLASSIYCEREDITFNANLSYPIQCTYNSSDLGINNTSRLVIFVNNFAQPDYYLVYENSAIFKFVWSLNNSRPLILSDQKMFVDNTVNIFLINSTNFKSISTTSTVDIAVIPVSIGKAYAKNLTISFESVYPEYWNSTLYKLGYERTTVDRLNSYSKSYNVSRNVVTVHINNATVNIYYYVIVSGIGITSYGYNFSIEPWKMIKATYRDIDPIQINAGQSVTLGVKIIDKFLSPVIGAEVHVNSNGGTVRPSVTYTDSNGEAYAVFSSDTEGSYKVRFSSSGVNSVVYNISVVSGGTGGGGGGGGNVNLTLSCPEGWYTDGYLQKTIVTRVTSNGVPLPGCDVVFSANSSNVVFNPSRTTTNESGYAVTKVSQIVTGKHYYRIYAYALNSYVSHDILLNTTTPPDVHILKVYIENLMNQPLNDFQVRIVIDRSILDGIQNDGRDLRVAESIIDPYNQTQGKLPFWIESIDNSNVVLWVKVSLSERENKTIFIYWSGRDITSESNGNNVFIFFDDFSESTLNTTKWKRINISARITTINGYNVVELTPDWNTYYLHVLYTTTLNLQPPYIVACRYKDLNSAGGPVYYLVDKYNWMSWEHYVNYNHDILRGYKDGSDTGWINPQIPVSTANGVWLMETNEVLNESTINLYVNGVYKRTAVIPSQYQQLPPYSGIGFVEHRGFGPVYIDYIFVHKYARIKPKITIGEQIQ